MGVCQEDFQKFSQIFFQPTPLTCALCAPVDSLVIGASRLSFPLDTLIISQALRLVKGFFNFFWWGSEIFPTPIGEHPCASVETLKGHHPTSDGVLHLHINNGGFAVVLPKPNPARSVKTVNGKGPDENGNVTIPTGDGGEIDPEAIKSAVDEYLEANPPAQGAPGKDGQDGYTPVKGVDYFTPSEVEEIAAQAAEMVDVPTDEHINALINTALGVIENGTY